jgi:hypothetical protein
LVLVAAAAAMLLAPALADVADAQGRRGRVVGPRGGVVVRAYYRPLFYDPFFYDPFWYPYYPSHFGWYPPYAAAGGFYDDDSSVRLQVEPRETEVFIDGYYAGTVDDFDGFFQRLHVDPGEHVVTLYLEGHRSVTQKILLQPRKSFRISHTMEPLAAGEAPSPRPAAAARPPQAPPQPRPREATPGDPSFGAIAIRVQPADAEVLIDGERWEGPAVDEALVVQIAPGPHQIEVRKDGHRSYTAQVDVRAGQTAPINVSLPRQ